MCHRTKLKTIHYKIKLQTICKLLVISLVAITCIAVAGVREYKKMNAYADAAAWYNGNWEGINTAFDPPLHVEISILSNGEMYSYIYGQDKSYQVTTKKKTVKIKKLPNRSIRGKVRDSGSLILEDGGVLRIQQKGNQLETIVDKLGITVDYNRVTDPTQLSVIQHHIQDQQKKEAHHKDHDFWHSPEFWGVVGAGVAAAVVTDHHDHVKISSPGMSKSDAAALQKYYK